MTNDDLEQILQRIGPGEKASSKLMEALYAELHGIANRLMQSERSDHTLQPTALVHEAFLRLVDGKKIGEQGRVHFLGAAAVTMRRVLVDHARGASTQKRGGAGRKEHITLSGLGESDADDPARELDDEMDILALNDALDELRELDPRQAKIVELKFFGGMTGQQIADHVGVSRNTVIRELGLSRAWLRRQLAKRRDES